MRASVIFDCGGGSYGESMRSLEVKNLEAKFRLPDWDRGRRQAEAIGYRFECVLEQRDTFFRVARGKLKLREEGTNASIIYYAREERRADLALSTYEIVGVSDGAKMRSILADALGILAEVRKHRTLMMRDNVRFHLDRVEGLGDFGEIEAVIAERGDPEDSRGAVNELLAALKITPDALIGVSYFEMLSRD